MQISSSPDILGYDNTIDRMHIKETILPYAMGRIIDIESFLGLSM